MWFTSRRRPGARSVGSSLTVVLWLAGASPCASEVLAVEPYEITPPLCSRFEHSGKLACLNVVEVAVRIPPDASDPGLVRCVLRSEEQQILGIGEAILGPPAGRLWIVLRPRYRFDAITLHTRTDCDIRPYGVTR